MKAVLITPYFRTLGGGEKYFFSLAAFLVSRGWQVDIFGFPPQDRERVGDYLDLDLKEVNFLGGNFYDLNLLGKWFFLRRYDLCFFVSDGSLPFLFAKKNLVHFQVPFQKVGGRSLGNRFKLKRISKIVCNSFFTKKVIDQEFKVSSLVVYPPVAVDRFSPGKKEKLILCLSRFTDLLHNKRQDVLLEAFRQALSRPAFAGWRLVLAGGAQEGKDFVVKLQKAAAGLPVEIITDLSMEKVKDLYRRASFFWLATGYGLSPAEHPEAMEHFGMVTVEAMAAGAVPIVIAQGGQPEIIASGKDGFLWQNPEELVKLTEKLILDPPAWSQLSCEAQKKSRQFSFAEFCEAYEKII